MTTTLSLPAHWPTLTTDLSAEAITPADKEQYRLKRSTYMKVGSPELVLTPTSTEQVAEAVGYAAALRADQPQAPISVRSGGHGFNGGSTNNGGLVIDLSGLNTIDVFDPAAGLVKAQAGAVWGDVAAALAPHDLILTSGNMGDTGVGGLGTAGGIGYLARSSGLTIDRMRSATVVTADGTIHHIDADHEPDLFWAIRGGMGQVGVVTEMTFEATAMHSPDQDASLIQQNMQQVVTDLSEFTTAWGQALREAPHELTSFLRVQPVGDGRFVIASTNLWANTEVSAAEPVLGAMADLAPLAQHEAYLMPYTSIVPTPRWQHVGQQRIIMRDVVVNQVEDRTGTAIEEMFADHNTAVVELRSLGGAVSEVATDATAYAHRDGEAILAAWIQPVTIEAQDQAWRPAAEIGSGVYAGYTSDDRAATAELAWPGATGGQLRSIAAQRDPDQLFTGGLVLAR